MFVYNVTLKIIPEIEAEWLQWQMKEHIPEILATGQFSENKFYRLIELDDRDGVTYVSQFFSPSQESITRYLNEFAAAIRKKAFEKWGNKFIAFRTTMQLVQ
jgi:hypothetical protein